MELGIHMDFITSLPMTPKQHDVVKVQWKHFVEDEATW